MGAGSSHASGRVVVLAIGVLPIATQREGLERVVGRGGGAVAAACERNAVALTLYALCIPLMIARILMGVVTRSSFCTCARECSSRLSEAACSRLVTPNSSTCRMGWDGMGWDGMGWDGMG
jgi:hypothetical protein